MTKERESTLPSIGRILSHARIVDEAHRDYWAIFYELPVPFNKVSNFAKESFDISPGPDQYVLVPMDQKKAYPKRSIFRFHLYVDDKKLDIGTLEISEIEPVLTTIQSHLPLGTRPHDIVTLRLMQQSLEVIKTQIAYHHAWIQHFVMILDIRGYLIRGKGGELRHLPLRLPQNLDDFGTDPTNYLQIRNTIPEPSPDDDIEEWHLWYFMMNCYGLRLPSGEKCKHSYIDARLNLGNGMHKKKYSPWLKSVDPLSNPYFELTFGLMRDDEKKRFFQQLVSAINP